MLITLLHLVFAILYFLLAFLVKSFKVFDIFSLFIVGLLDAFNVSFKVVDSQVLVL
jgi:hypothetical protein|tara:strand:+ start:1415 stop:1582 length:168 start_codon:yes stop_codon:yes gene_type:complete